jgi:RNA polymerase primary sigma factor
MVATRLESSQTVDKQTISRPFETIVPAMTNLGHRVASGTGLTPSEEPEATEPGLAALSAAEEEALLGRGAGREGDTDESANGSEDLFQRYLRDIRGLERVTHADELALAQRSAAGDLHARRRLVEANLRLVIAYARWYMKSGVPLVDLIQEGNLGLMRAAEKFDWQRGYHFSTYATWWVRRAIRHAAGEQTRLIHVPEHVAARVSKIRSVSSHMAQRTGQDPTPREVAQASGIPVDEVKRLLRLTQQPASLDVPIDVERGVLLSDILEDPSVQPPEESAIAHVLSDEVHDALLQLTPGERAAIILRYGIGDGHSRTLREFGMQLGISRERVRHLIERALEKLRAMSSIQTLFGTALSAMSGQSSGTPRISTNS